MGRIGHAVKVRGMFVHPRQVDEVLSRFPEIERCQRIVTRAQHRDVLAVRVESSSPSPDLGERLAAELREVLKVRGEVAIVPPGTIAPDAKRIVDELTWD